MIALAFSSGQWRLAAAQRGPRLLNFDVTPYVENHVTFVQTSKIFAGRRNSASLGEGRLCPNAKSVNYIKPVLLPIIM